MLHLPHEIYAFLENACQTLNSKKPGIVRFYLSDETSKKYKYSMLCEEIPPVSQRGLDHVIVEISEEDIETWADPAASIFLLAALLKRAASKSLKAKKNA